MLAPLALVGRNLLENMLSSSGKKEDIDRVDSKIDAAQREQAQYNMKIAEMVRGQGQQLKNLESSNGRLSSRTDKLSDLFGESSLRLGSVRSDTSSLRRDQDRYGAQLNQFQSDQSGINMDLARREAEAGFCMFKEQQRSFNDDIKLETAGMQKRLDEHSTGLEVMRTRADGLQRDQDRINLDVARVNSRTVALQDKLGDTSTRVELVHARSELQQRRQDELSLVLRQTNQRIEQFNSDYNQRLHLIVNGGIRNEERQLHFMNNQTSLNAQLVNRTDALTSKFYETEGKLDQLKHRTDTLFKGQDKIDSEMRLERQINENRLREQIRRNEILPNFSVRIKERQNCVEKHIATEDKFEQNNHRADKEKQPQLEVIQKSDDEKLGNPSYCLVDKIDDQAIVLDLANILTKNDEFGSEIKIGTKIAKDRLRDKMYYNQKLANRDNREEENQNLLKTESKSYKELVIDRLENVHDKLGETSKKVDFVNFRVDNLHLAQLKTEHEQKNKDKQLHEMTQKLDGMEKCTNELLAEQTKIHELIENIALQMAEISARTMALENRFEALQRSLQHENEMKK